MQQAIIGIGTGLLVLGAGLYALAFVVARALTEFYDRYL